MGTQLIPGKFSQPESSNQGTNIYTEWLFSIIVLQGRSSLMVASSYLRDGDDGDLNVDLGRLVPLGGSGADCLADSLSDGNHASLGVGVRGDGGALNGVAAAAKGLAASSESRVSHAVDDGLVTGDDVAGEAAAELATRSDRHELPAAEVGTRGGGRSSANSENSRK
ncbi:hypothetical protein F4782DRAFT_508158 [Xylaria castorea]|nr:hypothetical protein F4782DRAFT_508158 [Xylaria castorea]